MISYTATTAIVAAGGSGRRMGGSCPKQFLPLAGRPVLRHTLERLSASPEISAMILVLPPAELAVGERLAAGLGVPCTVVAGGASRQESVRNGCEAAQGADILLVHDGARPLVTADLVGRVARAAAEHGAAIAAVPAKDTLKEVDGAGRILRTIDRAVVWQAQTPQAARRDLLLRAFAVAEADGFVGTDEAALLEHAGIPVTVVQGDPNNLKITVPADLQAAERLLGGNGSPAAAVRVGHGYDVHRLVAGRPLILGGVTSPHERGLLGHSDADVLVHALMDALLGAATLGDIGRAFPDSDPQYRGISSLVLLERVIAMLAGAGWRPASADITVVAQAPRLSPYLDAMRANLVRICATEAVNIKATTTERLGFAGRGEGIAAHAVVTVVAQAAG